jgi:hypothetical protein
VRFLTQHKDVRWLYEARFQPMAPAFFAALRPDQVSPVLDNLIELPKIDAQTERVLAALAKADYEGVWQFFGRRLERKADKSASNAGYEPIPHQFFQAHAAALGQNADRAVDIVRGWYGEDGLFQFRGGRLLAIAFPSCPPALRDKLVAIIASEGEASLSFISGILLHYHGDVATHPVCQAMIDCLPENDERLQQVRNLLRGTGIVRGAFGMSEAYQRKVAEISIGMVWGGPPRLGPIDGTVVPCAAGGSLPFLPQPTLQMLQGARERYGKRIWGRYGFADAFNPATGWVARDLVVINTSAVLPAAIAVNRSAVTASFLIISTSRMVPNTGRWTSLEGDVRSDL